MDAYLVRSIRVGASIQEQPNRLQVRPLIAERMVEGSGSIPSMRGRHGARDHAMRHYHRKLGYILK